MPQQNVPENFSVTTIITFIKYQSPVSDFLPYMAPVNDQTLPSENLRNSLIIMSRNWVKKHRSKGFRSSPETCIEPMRISERRNVFYSISRKYLSNKASVCL